MSKKGWIETMKLITPYVLLLCGFLYGLGGDSIKQEEQINRNRIDIAEFKDEVKLDIKELGDGMRHVHNAIADLRDDLDNEKDRAQREKIEKLLEQLAKEK